MTVLNGGMAEIDVDIMLGLTPGASAQLCADYAA